MKLRSELFTSLGDNYPFELTFRKTFTGQSDDSRPYPDALCIETSTRGLVATLFMIRSTTAASRDRIEYLVTVISGKNKHIATLMNVSVVNVF